LGLDEQGKRLDRYTAYLPDIYAMTQAFSTPGRRSDRLTNLPEKLKITGFSSPAADYECQALSIDEIVGLGAPHIWLWRLKSDALAAFGLHANDTLVVNRQTELTDGRFAVTIIEGIHRACLAESFAGALKLITVDGAGVRQEVEQTDAIEIWGVVDFVVRDLRQVRF
jgi:DNA polymerase V